MQGIIVKAISGFYYVKADNGLVECKAKGAFRNEGISPLVGDTVKFELKDDDTHGILNEVCMRRNSLYRPPIANVDQMIIVSSFCKPEPNSLIIDTVLAICEANGIIPILVFNKSDLGDFTKWCDIYAKTDYRVIVASANTGEGIAQISDELKSGITVFTGNSGVGKSSIINMVMPKLQLQTGEISEKLGRGRHTTRHVQLFDTPFGGYIADTPGFASIEVDRNDFSFKENLPCYFPEFAPFVDGCKFTGCSHTCEKGCRVIEAVENGDISISRHNSYKMLFNELKDLKKWQIKK